MFEDFMKILGPQWAWDKPAQAEEVLPMKSIQGLYQRECLLLALLVGLFVVVSGGCRGSAGPVRRVTIDPAKVAVMIFYPTYRITDRATIEKCMTELNSMSYKARHPKMGVRAPWGLDLRDADGGRIALFGFALNDHFWVEVPGSERCFIEIEPAKLPTIQKVITYLEFTDSRKRLQKLAVKKSWSDKDRVQVSINLIGIRYTSPDGEIEPEPQTPEDLKRALVAVKEYTLRDLDRFSLAWRP